MSDGHTPFEINDCIRLSLGKNTKVLQSREERQYRLMERLKFLNPEGVHLMSTHLQEENAALWSVPSPIEDTELCWPAWGAFSEGWISVSMSEHVLQWPSWGVFREGWTSLRESELSVPSTWPSY